MFRARVIPVLLLKDESLVKTRCFREPRYVGDPANTVRIFNELEVDELLFFDISATVNRRTPNLAMLADIADECFMPLGYGGGILSLDQAKAIFDIGFEKVSVNTSAFENPALIEEIAGRYGSQAVIVSIDVKNGFIGGSSAWSHGGRGRTDKDPVLWAKEVESRGAGEILLTSIDREGTWQGFDLELIKKVSASVSIPVVAHGGAGQVSHIIDAIQLAHADAVAIGSLVVFQKQDFGVLVNFPNKAELERRLR